MKKSTAYGIGATIAVTLVLVLSFSIWTAIGLGIAWAIGFAFHIQVPFMRVFLVTSLMWGIFVLYKTVLVFVFGKLADKFVK